MSWPGTLFTIYDFASAGSLSYYSQKIDVPNWFSGSWPLETCLHTCSPLLGPDFLNQLWISSDESGEDSKASQDRVGKEGEQEKGKRLDHLEGHPEEYHSFLIGYNACFCTGSMIPYQQRLERGGRIKEKDWRQNPSGLATKANGEQLLSIHLCSHSCHKYWMAPAHVQRTVTNGAEANASLVWLMFYRGQLSKAQNKQIRQQLFQVRRLSMEVMKARGVHEELELLWACIGQGQGSWGKGKVSRFGGLGHKKWLVERKLPIKWEQKNKSEASLKKRMEEDVIYPLTSLNLLREGLWVVRWDRKSVV